MFAKSPDSLRLTLRALACLLNYPDGVDLDVFRDWKSALHK